MSEENLSERIKEMLSEIAEIREAELNVEMRKTINALVKKYGPEFKNEPEWAYLNALQRHYHKHHYRDVLSQIGQENCELLDLPVFELDLNGRASRALDALGARYIGEVIQLSENDILECRQVGKKSVKEVKDRLKSLNLSLGMSIDYIRPEN